MNKNVLFNSNAEPWLIGQEVEQINNILSKIGESASFAANRDKTGVYHAE